MQINLAEKVLQRIFPFLELAPMPLGRVLQESGAVAQHVYFPTDAIVSLLYLTTNGASAEIAVVGYEGMIGMAIFTGGQSTTCRAVARRSRCMPKTCSARPTR